jgi:hypothetical protein
VSKAGWFARQQVRIAITLGDNFLKVKALLHLAYYFIRVRKFSAATKLIKVQKRRATEMESGTVSFLRWRVLWVHSHMQYIASHHCEIGYFGARKRETSNAKRKTGNGEKESIITRTPNIRLLRNHNKNPIQSTFINTRNMEHMR